MTEIFKDIKGYENLYQVSNLGNVKSLNYNRTGKEKILKPRKNNIWEHLQVMLCKNGKRKNYSVHRLVAKAFIPNPNNFPCVNHKDENPQNNCVSNLEWCTVAYNNAYGTARERRLKKISKPIKCLDLKTKISTYYPSISEAARHFNVYNYSISRCVASQKTYKKRFIFSIVQ